MDKLSRRQFLRNSAAVGVAAATPGFAQEFFSKPARLLGPARGNRVVIIGGGWGGISTARHLRRKNPAIEVVLIEKNPVFMSCPLSNLYLGGVKDLDFFVFDYTNVVRAGVSFVQERALEVNRTARYVRTTGGLVFYDYLVVSPGIDYMYEAIEGYGEVKQFLPVGFKPFEHVALKRQLEQFEGGDIVLSIPKPPYRCPPGPYERAALLAHYLKSNGIKGKVVVLDANNQPISKAAGFTAAYQELYKDYLEYVPNAEVTAVDHAARKVTTTLGEYGYDLANLIPPMKAGEIVRSAGLGERWANVRLPYFLSEKDERVYLVGDVLGNVPFSKSGQVAYNDGKIIAEHIASRVAGKRLEEIPHALPDNICYSFVDSEEAIWVAHKHEWDAAARQVKQQSTSDQKRSAQNGALALEWARGLWGDMFGPGA
ncbi:FAD-dependent oxidoreductase [Calidithermus roseus]|uniref:Sulfide dehydrogenase [flavocytochrome c] flavoprotein chain n=1 Tax=Calidithermus roseus TaxID=1644118 RepID=A0A399EXV6_9DEIN|nr:FAD-dependent oxidoreductase [Calidithermus roseus]RIH89404.1 Sulfide dehydrogenase [flavocytochrome c] flavoprotein chain [Calidithermus roseus]